MKEDKVLYHVKVLDKLIVREFINEKEQTFLPTPTQMVILEYILNHSKEDIYQKDLENILNLRRATVSGVLQTMEKHNLVERVTCDNDARSKKIILRSEAKVIFENRGKKFDELEMLVKKDITEEELKEFFRIINKMQDNLIKYASGNNRKEELC